MLRIGSAAFAKKLRQAREPSAGRSLIKVKIKFFQNRQNLYSIALVLP